MSFPGNSIDTPATSLWQRWTDRPRARFTSERVLLAEDEEAPRPAEQASPAEQQQQQQGGGTGVSTVSPLPLTSQPTSLTSHEQNHHEEEDEQEGHFQNEPLTVSDDDEEEVLDFHTTTDEEMGEMSPTLPADDVPTTTATTGSTAASFYQSTLTLAELQEERELARRRMSACMLLTIFVLFKLWIDCLAEPSVPLLMVCLIGTSWTARWIRYNRDREQELDRRIAQYLQQQRQQQQQQRSQNGNNNNGNQDDAGAFMNRDDLRLLSFQAQLALAIMESQRQFLEGGLPDDTPSTPGVSDAAKRHWKVISYDEEQHEDGGMGTSAPTKYGSTSSAAAAAAMENPSKDNMDAPHCSICLCEYETAESLYELPCRHVFHKECIDSWTSNHTKCPLCNLDLESVAGDSEEGEDVTTATTSSETEPMVVV